MGGGQIERWQSVAARKRSTRESILQGYSKWRLDRVPDADVLDVSELCLSKLTDKEKVIVHHDATELIAAIVSKQYTAVEVLWAFIKVAIVAQDTTNCLTEIFFDDGLTRAEECDRYLEETGNVLGPLHGLPVSVKDHILLKGQDTSTGYILWANKTIADEDATAVALLRKAGAVLYAKTANPQTLLSLETNNNVFGRTLNVFNRKLSPGGSSGGEGALIAAHGSPLGLGTDIGGSIRTPAAFSGLYGFKPSVARMPHAGLMGSQAGMDNMVGALGPIATSARDLELFSRVMLQYEPWFLEPPLLRMPWQEEVAKGKGLPKKLSIAILWDDGVVAPHPPIRAALEEAKAALLAAGHEVLDWQPLNHHMAVWTLICKLYLLDGGKEYHDTLNQAGEPAVPQTAWILSQHTQAYTAAQTWPLNVEREAIRTQVLRYWNETVSRTGTGRPFDAILCPCHPTLASEHDTTRWWGYTSYWNLLDYTAAVFPVGRHQKDHKYDWDLPAARNPTEEYIHSLWDAERYQNAPVSLQLVGRRHDEEKVLAVLDSVEGALKKARKIEESKDERD
ncbi:amidase [Calocera viscosa TUFC12733]|uniref:amidase n=1 Tax=Calocera viscosa (strain TUFC12733) TaxID=1330018 RepID=A0A167M7N0_CALVF|nr:amidase [Calocera viscosa TUFC12733]